MIVLSNSYSPVSQSPIADDLAAIALGEQIAAPASVTRVDVGTDKLHSVLGAYRFDQTFFQPNAEVRIRIEREGAGPGLGKQSQIGPDSRFSHRIHRPAVLGAHRDR